MLFRMNDSPSQDQVQAILAKNGRAQAFRDAFLYGWEEAHRRIPEIASFARVSSKRALVWEFTLQRLKSNLADDPGFRTLRHMDTVSIILDGEVLLRLKKADSSRRTSNFPTRQSGLFHCHQQDLFGPPRVSRVQAIYIPNDRETGIEWIGVVAKSVSGDVLWEIKVTDEISAVPVESLPQGPEREEGPVVKLKGTEQAPSREKSNRGTKDRMGR